MPHTAIPILALLLAASAFPLTAQNVQDEFWPELDIYVQQGSYSRIVFADSFHQDETTHYLQGIFTYYFELALKPIFRRELREREDVFRRRFLTFRSGYRYITSMVNGNSSSENRIIAESTARYPLPARFVVSDRNRGEFRFIKGQPFSMRYRNRLWIERDVRLGPLVFTPFAYDEIFYDTRYDAWNQNRYAFGIQIPTGPHVVVEPYYLRQTNTLPTRKLVNAKGLTLSLYF